MVTIKTSQKSVLFNVETNNLARNSHDFVQCWKKEQYSTSLFVYYPKYSLEPALLNHFYVCDCGHLDALPCRKSKTCCCKIVQLCNILHLLTSWQCFCLKHNELYILFSLCQKTLKYIHFFNATKPKQLQTNVLQHFQKKIKLRTLQIDRFKKTLRW